MSDIQCRQDELSVAVELRAVAAARVVCMVGFRNCVPIQRPLEGGSQFRRCGRRDADRAGLLRGGKCGEEVDVPEARPHSAIASHFRECSRGALFNVRQVPVDLPFVQFQPKVVDGLLVVLYAVRLRHWQ